MAHRGSFRLIGAHMRLIAYKGFLVGNRFVFLGHIMTHRSLIINMLGLIQLTGLSTIPIAHHGSLGLDRVYTHLKYMCLGIKILWF